MMVWVKCMMVQVKWSDDDGVSCDVEGKWSDVVSKVRDFEGEWSDGVG